ncbi:MAG: SDR family NAD(P)-dependent oxidoreductase [Proteobacteria bacterium]|nr:SDR family NAD(P)-dependent oxidoreductase [Pseudomonadota bacterium]MBU4294498.1 SDR family NAD(P)-dependent oxidoreductase [Pseudomonadota bacterium]MCG2747034.1 SDR family NAD(P)-dependent oxidoreductase [Desulfobulbaceae bacterium]
MKETILITGANRGIGLELALEFARNGWEVIDCCRRPAEAADPQAIEAGSRGGQPQSASHPGYLYPLSLTGPGLSRPRRSAVGCGGSPARPGRHGRQS